MASLGSKVLQTRSVELAMVHKHARARAVELRGARSLQPVRPDTWDQIGTIICDEDEIVEQQGRQRHRLRQGRGEDHAPAGSPTSRASRRSIFGPLAEANINVDMIVQNLSADGKSTDMTFTVQESELDARARGAEGGQEGHRLLRGQELQPTSPRFRSSASACAAMPASQHRCSRRLAGRGINILAISTSEIKISVLIDAAYAELAVRTLHAPVRAGQRLIAWALPAAAAGSAGLFTLCAALP